MRVAAALLLVLSLLCACDQLNKPMAVPNGGIGPIGGTSASSSGAPAVVDAGSDALPPLPAPGAPRPMNPQPGDVQL